MDQPTPPSAGDTPLVNAALIHFTTALDELIKVTESDNLAVLDDESLISFAQELEKARNRVGIVDHQLIGDATRRELGHKMLMRNTTGLLRHIVHIGAGEARARERAAEAVAPRRNLQGEVLPPKRPHLAEAFRAGRLNPAQLDAAVVALNDLDKGGIAPDRVTKAEARLADLGSQFDPKEFRTATKKMLDVHFPDGTLDDERHHTMRNFFLKPNQDGSFTPGGRVTPSLGAQLQAVLSPLAKPRPAEDGSLDPRDIGQRMHDALEDSCRRLLRVGGLPHSGGTPATVIITIDLEKLLARTGHGETSDGTLISTEEVLRLANEAEIIPAVFRRHGLPLDLGRSRRIANKNQTLALIARDSGCSFPGCTAPPEQCERHHIIAWINGGLTKIDNMTLLCGYHHRNFLRVGWVCRMINNLPHWIPPRWHDPDQTPQLHHRIRQRLEPAA